MPQPFSLVIPLDFLTGADDTALLWQVPSADEGGGVTITSAKFTNLDTTSGTVGFDLQLLVYSDLGTPALGGTVGAALGGTLNHWAAGVPKSFTLSTVRLSAGQWLAIKKTEATTTSDPRGTLVINGEIGR